MGYLIFVAACWVFAFWQWAMMFTDGHFDSRESWPEWLQTLEVVARSFAIIVICFGSLFLGEAFS